MGILILFIFVISHLISQNKYGEGEFDKSITNTKNMIAYTHYISPNKFGVRIKEDVYLLNVKTGKKYQLTNDRYEYSYLAWSSSGDRLLFTSKINTEEAVLWDESRNPSYLCTYNFKNKTERILEDKIKKEVHNLGLRLKKEGYNIEFYNEEYRDTSYPFWIDTNRIGFLRELPFGLGRAYGVLCTTDTNGMDLKAYKDFSKYPEWRISEPQWINEDSVIVYLTTFDLDDHESYIALFLSKQNRYIYLNDKKTDVCSAILSNDRKKILYYEWKDNDIFQVMQTLKNGKKEKIKVEKVCVGSVLSPQGTKLAFLKENEYGSDIYIMSINRKNQNRMTFDGGVKGFLSWSPNSIN